MERAWLAVEGASALEPSELKSYAFPEATDCCAPNETAQQKSDG